MAIITEEKIDEKREIKLREREERVGKREKEIREMEVKIRKKFEEEIEEKEKEIRKKEEEMTKRVKRMVELESKIREREIEVEKKEKEIEEKTRVEREIEIREKERLEEEKRKKERLDRERVEEEKRKKEEEERIKKEKIEREEEEKQKGKNMLDEILREQQKKMEEMMTQIEAMTKEVKMPTMFFGVSWKVESFVKECREYIEIKMKEKTVKDQILWVLTCMDGGTVQKWKEIMEDNLKEGLREYVILEEFFGEIRKEFGKKGKGKKIEEDREKGMDGFWNAVKGKEVEIVKKKPKVEAMTPRIPAVGRGSGFKKR